MAPLYIHIIEGLSQKLRGMGAPCIMTLNHIRILIFYYYYSTAVTRASRTSWPRRFYVSELARRNTPQIVLTAPQIGQLNLIVLHFVKNLFPKNSTVCTSPCLQKTILSHASMTFLRVVQAQ